MTDAQKTISDLETPICDTLAMVEIVAELLEAMTGSTDPESLVLGTYHAVTLEAADRLQWAAYDAVSRMQRLKADWEAVKSAHHAATQEASQ